MDSHTSRTYNISDWVDLFNLSIQSSWVKCRLWSYQKSVLWMNRRRQLMVCVMIAGWEFSNEHVQRFNRSFTHLLSLEVNTLVESTFGKWIACFVRKFIDHMAKRRAQTLKQELTQIIWPLFVQTTEWTYQRTNIDYLLLKSMTRKHGEFDRIYLRSE